MAFRRSPLVRRSPVTPSPLPHEGMRAQVLRAVRAARRSRRLLPSAASLFKERPMYHAYFTSRFEPEKDDAARDADDDEARRSAAAMRGASSAAHTPPTRDTAVAKRYCSRIMPAT